MLAIAKLADHQYMDFQMLFWNLGSAFCNGLGYMNNKVKTDSWYQGSN